MTHKNDRVLSVTELARVEGEGALYIRASGNKVTEARLDIYEPPRFFEAFLRGRGYTEPPDITARICGICPVAYQMSACLAIEDACGVTVEGPIADLRRLLYCGEWIESHALHIYLLHAPDFLGYSSGIEMAAERRDIVERGLALKKAGNTIMEVVGGRAIHPVNVRVGGFYRAPARAELAALTDPLRRALDGALDTVRWVAGFDFPDHTGETDMLALSRPGTYPIERGTVATRAGLAFPAAGWNEHVIEEHVAHSNALHAHLADGSRYLTGPLARYSLSSRWLSPLAREAAHAAGLGATCDNPFRSIIVRAVETVYAIDEALRLIAAYEPPERSAVEVPPRAGVGHGVTEAPRGTLYHRYQIGADGIISAAKIVPPTSQNQAAIEADLRTFAEARLDLDDAELTRQCEQAIRNYDPCISCATHFLDLTIERSLSIPNGRWFPFQLQAARRSWSSAWATRSGATTARGPRWSAGCAIWCLPACASWSPTASPPGWSRPGPGRRWPSWSTRSAPSRRSRAGSIVSWWTGREPDRPGRRARTASAWTTRSAWRWPWTGCPGG
jgi:sulfhydrogenase subunit alpha